MKSSWTLEKKQSLSGRFNDYRAKPIVTKQVDGSLIHNVWFIFIQILALCFFFSERLCILPSFTLVRSNFLANNNFSDMLRRLSGVRKLDLFTLIQNLGNTFDAQITKIYNVNIKVALATCKSPWRVASNPRSARFGRMRL